MTESIEIPRAVREAKMFGDVDVYEMAGGRIVLSCRGATASLTGAGFKTMGIATYVRGISEEIAGFKLEVFQFKTPRGVLANGLELATFRKIVSWWANKFIAGALKENQRHIGANCAAMQSAAADLGWETLARAAFGEAIPSRDIPIAFAAWVREHAAEYQTFYTWELAEELAPLCGVSRPIQRTHWPVYMPGIHEFLYDACLSKSTADEARKLQKGAGTQTVHQHLSDQAKKTLASYVPTFIGLARSAHSLKNWKSMVRNVLGIKEPVQEAMFPDELRADPSNSTKKESA